MKMKKVNEIEIVAKNKEGFECPSCRYFLTPEDDDIEVLEVDGECGAHRLYSILIRCPECGQKIRIRFDSN